MHGVGKKVIEIWAILDLAENGVGPISAISRKVVSNPMHILCFLGDLGPESHKYAIKSVSLLERNRDMASKYRQKT